MDDNTHSLQSGDESCLEDGQGYLRRLNSGRFYSNMPTWKLHFNGDLVALRPRCPITFSFIALNAILIAFFYGAYWILPASSKVGWRPAVLIGFVAITTLLFLWGISFWAFLKERKYGDWLAIDQKAGTVTLVRFGVTCALKNLELLITIRRKGARAMIGSDELPDMEKWDLDAIVELEGRRMRFSLVGDIGGHAVQAACNRLNKELGVKILKRVR